MKNMPIGEVLKEYGYITNEQIEIALKQQKDSGTKKRLGQILIDMNFVTEQQVIEALSQKLGYACVNIETIKVDIDAVQLIPKSIALKYNLIAVRKYEGRLSVVMSDPLNFYAVEDVRQIAGIPLEIFLCISSKINDAISYYYAEINAKDQFIRASKDVLPVSAADIDLNLDDSGDASVVKLLNSMLNQGYNSGASDIHVEPLEGSTLVRIRIDGVIIDYVTLPSAIHQSLIARIKIMSSMDIAERRLPQDGHFRAKIEGNEINIRTSIIPTVYGEKAVMRFLTNNSPIDHSNQFGMSDNNYAKVVKMLNAPHGIIYITGPTGSGKTTTLYMILEAFAKRPVNISTIEDPVERNINRINQVQVNNVSGLTFESGLRAILRQDPDIIMVGETRDSETASISVRAAITGHLVFSTLHTNDAVSSIVRLEDMGLPRYMVANSVVGIIAQRLVRKICPYCKEEYAPDMAQREILGPNVTKLYHGKGCNFCKNTGYKGRIAIHEVLFTNKDIRKMITEGASVDEITSYARKYQAMKNLRESAVELVANGVTTIEELLKVAYTVD
ncbi:MAG: ATPase, T2SS/T4P/T4SS family [Oscillospiraceae bacterium]